MTTVLPVVLTTNRPAFPLPRSGGALFLQLKAPQTHLFFCCCIQVHFASAVSCGPPPSHVCILFVLRPMIGAFFWFFCHNPPNPNQPPAPCVLLEYGLFDSQSQTNSDKLSPIADVLLPTINLRVFFLSFSHLSFICFYIFFFRHYICEQS